MKYIYCVKASRFSGFFSNIGILRIPDSFFTTEKDAGTVIPTCMSPKVPVPGAVLCVSCSDATVVSSPDLPFVKRRLLDSQKYEDISA